MLSRNHLRGLATLILFVAASAGPAAAFQLPWAQRPARPVADGAQVIQVQANDPRLMTLEEEIRKLNGRLEELNFQILQMQDQMRRMQEDTEFRFQELEGGAAGQAAKPEQRSERLAPPAGAPEQTAASSVPPPPAASAPAAATPPLGAPPTGAPQAGAGPELGAPPRTLGTITFDQNGNVVSSGAGEPVDLLRGTAVEGTDGAVVAALPHSDNPEEIYQSSYQFILSGDYKTAEAGFRQYLTMFPDGSHAPDANFWLGEAMLGQDRYREAAEVFLNANRQYPEASKAPEMLLKLGVSLAAMNQRDVACATYTEIGHRYPNVSSALKERVKQEQALAGC